MPRSVQMSNLFRSDVMRSAASAVRSISIRSIDFSLVDPLLVPRGNSRCRSGFELGVDRIVLSNRGGRPLDHAPAPIAVIPEIVKTAAGTRMIDSDFRRRSDVGKAVASGAKAVMLERAPLYGLAAGGEGDVSEVIDIFKDEIDRTLALVERSYSGESRCHLHRRSPDLRCRRHLLPISRSPPCVGGGDLL